MPLEAQSREIDGKTYTVSPFVGEESVKIWTRLVKLLGPSFGSWSDVGMGAAVTKLCELLDENDFSAFVIRLLKSTRQNGTLIDRNVFNVVFAGELAHLFNVLAFVVEVNYGDFYKGDSSIGVRIRTFLKRTMTIPKEPNAVAASPMDLTPN